MMILTMKKAQCLFLAIIAASVLVQPVAAITDQLTVQAGEAATRSLKIAVDDRVLIDFVVVEGTIGFQMVCPNRTIKDFGYIGKVNYPFVCTEAGDYVLHFSNTHPSESRFITLNYEIQHYIFGMPYMLFLTMIIVVVGIIAVAVFVRMSKPR